MNKEYYQKHREEILERHRLYYIKNKKKILNMTPEQKARKQEYNKKYWSDYKNWPESYRKEKSRRDYARKKRVLIERLLVRSKENFMTELDLQLLINKNDTETIVKEINEMKQKIIDQQNQIKQKDKELDFYKARLVEVCENCKEKQNCIDFPEYCEGEKKEVLCLLHLMGEAADNGKIS